MWYVSHKLHTTVKELSQAMNLGKESEVVGAQAQGMVRGDSWRPQAARTGQDEMSGTALRGK